MFGPLKIRIILHQSIVSHRYYTLLGISLDVVYKNKEVQVLLDGHRRKMSKIALIPTMGNLHDGHLSLIELAREYADYIVVSIFVNPTQFNDKKDFENYPRTLESDIEKLTKAGVNLLFLPGLSSLYPNGTDYAIQLIIPERANDLCGQVRPGHFEGVVSVVLRLFNIIKPDISVFGQKDFQQKLLIEQMVMDLSLNIKIIGAPIIRERDGLAMSSRNQHLSLAAKLTAIKLHKTLLEVSYLINSKKGEFTSILKEAEDKLISYGFDVDYISIRSSIDLSVPNKDSKKLVILAGVVIEGIRLIDNIVID